MSNYITEAFQQFYLTEDAEDFPINSSGPAESKSLIDLIAGDDEENLSDVYDLEAEAKEDLKDSYIGKVILNCNVCHSNVFYDKDQVTENEDGLCCQELECPYCMSNEGYTIIGEVAPYGEVPDEPYAEDEPEIDIESEEVEIEEPESTNEDDFEEGLEEGLKLDKVKELDGDDAISGEETPIDGTKTKGLEANDDIRGPKYKEFKEAYQIYSDVDGDIVKVKSEAQAKAHIKDFKIEDKKDKSRKGKKIKYGYKKLDESCDDSDKIEEGVKDSLVKAGKEGLASGIEGAANSLSSDLREGIEDISINTEDETMTMTSKEDGGVTIETTPKIGDLGVDEFGDGEEMIAPLSPETEEDINIAIDNNSEEGEEDLFNDLDLEGDMDLEEPAEDEFDEFDEESFNELGESYLKRCYENVKTFKTTGVSTSQNGSFLIEGLIGFDSGNIKETQFEFTPSKDNKLKLEGYNKQISNGKKTFKLNCSTSDKKLVCESLNFNYKSKNELDESVRVYGTVKRKTK